MREVHQGTQRLCAGHSSEFEPTALAQARALLELAFAGDFGQEDWRHALGGLQVLLWEGSSLVGHAALVSRALLHGGAPLSAGYVEAVAVHPDFQRRGLGHQLMAHVERALLRTFELGALSASEGGAAFYRRRGWLTWRGPLAAVTPRGVEPTPDEAGGIFVFPGSRRLDLDAPLTCDWRAGDLW